MEQPRGQHRLRHIADRLSDLSTSSIHQLTETAEAARTK